MSAPWAALVLALAAAVIALSAAFIALSRRIAPVLSRTEAWLATPRVRPPGLGVGARVHSFTALRPDGSSFSEQDLLGRTSVVVFVKADCAICRRLSSKLTRTRLDTLARGVPTYVVVRDRQEQDALALDPNLNLIYQEDGTASWAFRSSATPQAFVLNPEGIVAAVGFPNSLRDLGDLISSADPIVTTNESAREVPL